MNNLLKPLGLSAASFICAFLLGCTTLGKNSAIVTASISDKPIKLIYDKEDPKSPSLLIPVEITIDNDSPKSKVFSSVFFSKGLIHDFCVYEIKNDKLIKRKQTRNDTIIIPPGITKQYIAYSNIDIYMPYYPEFNWKDRERKLLESGTDTLHFGSYKVFRNEHEKLGNAVSIDSLKLWFYDADSEDFKESLQQLKIAVDH